MFCRFPSVLTFTLLTLAGLRNQVSQAREITRDGATRTRPNILLLLTDDQDVLIGGTDHMARLRKHLGDHGLVFRNYFVHTPICCPSRSSIFTGKYLHNLNTLNNSLAGNCYGKRWREREEKETFAVLAQRDGYHTAFAGKYLNQYGHPRSYDCGSHSRATACVPPVPPGWNHWMGLIGNSKYYDYGVVLSNQSGKNVTVQKHGSDAARDYFPTLVARRTIQSLRAFAQKNKPFLIMTSWPTPHAPFTPAPRDQGRFAGYQAYRTPNWNSSIAENGQKHWLIRQLHSINDLAAQHIDFTYQLRQEALQSIDRHVGRFVKELERLGQLIRTIIVYTSDNGFQLGQHCVPGDKRQLYEHDIRVPMLVRGPVDLVTKAHGSDIDHLITNIDVAPTIVDWTVRPSSNKESALKRMDGQSFASLLKGGSHATTPDMITEESREWRQDFLVSYHGEGDPSCGVMRCPPQPGPTGYYGDSLNNTYHCLRTLVHHEAISSEARSNSGGRMIVRNTIYCEFVDDESFVEYYDLIEDPWQLQNRAGELAPEEQLVLKSRLGQLRKCQGPSCRTLRHSWTEIK